MRESDIEALVNEKVSTEGLIPIKITPTARKGWPDRGYLYKERIAFVEYKKPGEPPEPLQEHIHGILRKAGFLVAVVTQVDYGITVLLEWKRYVDRQLEKVCG